MNHIGQLFLFISAVIGTFLVLRSRENAHHLKVDALDHVARIQVDEHLTQTQKDVLVLSWVKTLAECHEISSLFSDVIVGLIVLFQIMLLAASIAL